METVAVLDSGGQYCHLIARKVRELGTYAQIYPIGTPAGELAENSGIILSGGPSSVFDESSPQPDPGLFEIGRPLLGICYGHQLIAGHLGGLVERGDTHEFGSATLSVHQEGGLFDGMEPDQQVWMSHGDHVARIPDGFQVLGTTGDCDVAAMGHPGRGIYGLQFHPEVVHTPNGSQILRNFLVNACGCGLDWNPRGRIEGLIRQIKSEVAGRRVLFFLSGGVDSTVAYALTVRALGTERVEGVYVDTGFMRDGETAEIEESFRALDLGCLRVCDASGRFMSSLRGIVDPESKRAAIGQAFVDVQDEILAGDQYGGHDWMLGQGTIYPDTIESGGTQAADVIKTHHNRVERIQNLIEEGRVLEPLSEFYKDEVRELGSALGLSSALLERHPFPGPGLAIRCLCSGEHADPIVDEGIGAIAQAGGYQAFLLPIKSVGVQGDSRSYARLTVLHSGDFAYERLLPLSTAITNEFRNTNRIVAALAPRTLAPSEWKIRPVTLTPGRVRLLQQVDRAVTEYLRAESLYDEIWQCPVVLLPLSRTGGEAVALRPVNSVDGMTAAVSTLPTTGLFELAERLQALDGIDAVLFDVSNKPPSTIEWE